MDKGDDPWEILGVSRDASDVEIKKTFRKGALLYHPDRQSSEEDRAAAQHIFAKFSAAYDTLSDPVKLYDWKLAKEKLLEKEEKRKKKTELDARREVAIAKNQERLSSHHPPGARNAPTSHSSAPFNEKQAAQRRSSEPAARTPTPPQHTPNRVNGSVGNSNVRSHALPRRTSKGMASSSDHIPRSQPPPSPRRTTQGMASSSDHIPRSQPPPSPRGKTKGMTSSSEHIPRPQPPPSPTRKSQGMASSSDHATQKDSYTRKMPHGTASVPGHAERKNPTPKRAYQGTATSSDHADRKQPSTTLPSPKASSSQLPQKSTRIPNGLRASTGNPMSATFTTRDSSTQAKPSRSSKVVGGTSTQMTSPSPHRQQGNKGLPGGNIPIGSATTISDIDPNSPQRTSHQAETPPEQKCKENSDSPKLRSRKNRDPFAVFESVMKEEYGENYKERDESGWKRSSGVPGLSKINPFKKKVESSTKEFKKLDINHDNALSKGELSKYIESHTNLWATLGLNLNLSVKKCIEIATSVAFSLACGERESKHSDRELTKAEFKMFHKQYVLDEKGSHEFFLRTIFAAFDLNGDGVLNAKELTKVLDVFYKATGEFKEKMKLPEKKNLLMAIGTRLDSNKDGVLDFDEVRDLLQMAALVSTNMAAPC
jgi:curved DNA-binding protein CbpA/Ca2+-binding EF-hand superfamily protein